MVFYILVAGGIYATGLAIIMGSFSSPALMIFWLVIIFAIMLVGIILTNSLGSSFFRDPSIIPTGFLRFIIRWIFPFGQVTAVTSQVFNMNSP